MTTTAIQHTGSVLREAVILTGRSTRHWRARPVTFSVQLLFPVLIMLLMGGLLGGAIAGTTGDYIVFVVPGVLAFTVLSGIETTITAVTGDAAKTVTDRFRTLPISRGSVLLGRVFADMLTAAVELAVVSAAGLLLGWRPEGGIAAIALTYALLLWLRFGLLWAGVWIGLKAGTPEAATTTQLAIWPVAFLSTVFVDPRTMPSWLGAAAEWNPLSATASAARELLSGGELPGVTAVSDHAVLFALGWPLALTLVFVPLAIRAYRRLS
ncbi:ABC-type multidrug transport system permease subunit [Murinocardiopsis flavida]|uniref:Transport permease protein n=1 Tax=Murinocardiopsis flavida TaxID=645275 RepID=A0A2P8DS71_9ACTN|nr:ABC transporter permease [Murinocardiopsis flavida]PSL00066.1 ABC-type multidrug transport system permease subunit [Murinocardiopsis flavida]